MNIALTHINEILSLIPVLKKDGRNLLADDLGIIKNGTVIYNKDEILWVGKTGDEPKEIKIDKFINKSSHVLTPGIIDSHTHLVFGGDRSFEYSQKLNGVDYQAIANAGGGILETMNSTLKLSEDELFDESVKRINRIYSYGVKVIEIKSGYALTYEGEKRLTKVISKLKNHFKDKVLIHNTFMAAHAVPSNFQCSKDYINQVVIPLMNELQSEIDSVDIFFEKDYFTLEDSELLFKAALKLNLPIKIHADEFNDNKGAILATKYNALSADHLLCTGDDGIKALANSNTVATLLPGTAFFLGKALAPAKKFLNEGVKLALASDYNPGSCHCDNLLLIASISAKNLEMNLTQIWAAMTYNAAGALGLKETGIVKEKFKPNFSLFKCQSVDQITYSWGQNLFSEV